MFEIDKGVEIPAKRARRRNYPFREMEVGDSFFVPTDKPANVSASICGCVRSSRYPGKRFTSRKVEGGVRCWRIE